MIKALGIFQKFNQISAYLYKYKLRILLAIFVTIPVGIMDAFIAWTLKPFMDVVMIEKNLSSTSWIPILIICFSFFQSAFNYLSDYLNAWITGKISQDLKIDLFSKLMRYEASFFDNSSSGTVQHRFNSDVDKSCEGFINNVKTLIVKVFSSISLLIVLLINSWKLTIVAIIVMLCAIYPLKNLRKRISGFMEKSVVASADVITHYSEVFYGNRIIASYNLYKFQLRKFLHTLGKVFKLHIKLSQRKGILSPIMHFIISIGISAIIWLGSYLIFQGELSAGGFVSFITALLLLYQPLKSIGNDFHELQLSLMAMDRVFHLLNKNIVIKPEKEAKKLHDIVDGIEYKNISFSYQAGKIILDSINLNISVGETIALVGASGCGKSTLSNLLLRFYDPISGDILIDGISIRDLNVDSLRSKIAVVFQDNFLFSGSIRDNIILDTKNVSDEKMAEIVSAACLDEFVNSLEFGLETQIGERGALLSGGQRQRIAIARAFLKNAPIVILDEATSALDNKSESIVQKAIENLMSNKTVIIIAHRLSTIKSADKIVVLNDGKIVEIGKHDDLISSKESAYYALYNNIDSDLT